MTSQRALIVIGLLFVATIFIVQSAPVEPLKEATQKVDNPLHKSDDLEKPSITTSSPPTTVSSLLKDALSSKQESKDIKKKRNINSYDQVDDVIDDKSDEDDDNDDDSDDYTDYKKNDHKLLTSIKEISSQFHDNTDNSVDTENSNVFTDFKMDPDELKTVARKRRFINLDPKPNQRRKRALTAYDFYDEEDPLYEPLIERRPFFRPNRAFAPLYWYPSVYERNIRSALVPSLYESPEWTKIYPNTIETDDDDDVDEDEDLIPLPINEDDDVGENDYDYMRYPILLDAPNHPYDNLQLQRQYNVDDSPMDDDDPYEQRLIATYGPMSYYLK